MSGGLHKYDLRTRGKSKSYAGHVNSRTRLEFSIDPAMQLISAPGEDGLIRIWDLDTEHALASFGSFGSVPARPGACAVLRSDWGGCGPGRAGRGAGPSPALALLAPGQDYHAHSLDFYAYSPKVE